MEGEGASHSGRRHQFGDGRNRREIRTEVEGKRNTSGFKRWSPLTEKKKQWFKEKRAPMERESGTERRKGAPI